MDNTHDHMACAECLPDRLAHINKVRESEAFAILDAQIELVNDILMRKYPGIETNEERRSIAGEIVSSVNAARKITTETDGTTYTVNNPDASWNLPK